jgi:hypothetical protein
MMNGFADRNRLAAPRAFDGTEPGFLVRHDNSPRSIVTSVNQIAMVRAKWHDAPVNNQFVSLYKQRIHRSLHPRQQQFRRLGTNAGTMKRDYLFLLPTNSQMLPFDLSADELKSHSVLKSSGASPKFLITLASLKLPVAGSPLRLKATAPT